MIFSCSSRLQIAECALQRVFHDLRVLLACLALGVVVRAYAGSLLFQIVEQSHAISTLSLFVPVQPHGYLADYNQGSNGRPYYTISFFPCAAACG